VCGIAGIIDFRGQPVDPGIIEGMCGLLAHRGPDHQGTRIRGGVGLGHRRLAITDLVTGQQPLANEDGSVWVVFNGEVYNYLALRDQLREMGHSFTTETDTEVIPHLYEEYGDGFVEHLEGNWAIALWDEKSRRLILTRDRIGKKPLTWMARDGMVRFASEAKALFADPSVSREVDHGGMLDVIHYGFTTEDRTMFAGVAMVPPATLLVFEEGREVKRRRYWDFADIAPYRGSLSDARAEFTSIMSTVTGERCMGDVPYGLMLSGGIDSPLVGSFLVEHQPTLKTYTIARRDSEDETSAAATVARHLGSDHHVIDLEEANVARLAARIPWMFDQPFFNDAAIANFQFAQAISAELTVAITGDGGDHAFSGTLRHLGDEYANRIRRVPRPLVAAGAGIVESSARIVGDRRSLRQAHHVLRASAIPTPRRWIALHQQNLPARHRELLATPYWDVDGYDSYAAPLGHYRRCRSAEHLNRLLYADLRFQLPPNDLLKVDRTFMYNQIAGRAPLLDHRVIEFAASLPAAWKRKGRVMKWFLRDVAAHRLPREVVSLPKVGLAVPLRTWLRGPLGQKVGDVIRSESFARRGIFDPGGARTALDAHRAGRVDYGYSIWTMAMTELWYRSFADAFVVPDERIWE
jgi:asparagine synthase (glutamine-hydrolysing)